MKSLSLKDVAVYTTSENIRKVYKTLKMFNQKIWPETKIRLENSIVDNNTHLHLDNDGEFIGVNEANVIRLNKKVISNKQLKQILALENLKKGDFIIGRGLGEKGREFVAKVVSVDNDTESHLIRIHLKSCRFFRNESLYKDGIIHGQFIRFATKKEIKFLKNGNNESNKPNNLIKK